MENTQPEFRGCAQPGLTKAQRRGEGGGWRREPIHVALTSAGLAGFKVEVHIASETSLSHITPASDDTSPSKDDT